MNSRLQLLYYIYTMEYYSVVNKNRMMPFPATQVGLEIVMLSDISQTEKENNILWHALYMEHKKK